MARPPDPSSDSGNDDWSRCVSLLRQLVESPEACLLAGSPQAEVARLAALLGKRLKEARRREARERDADLAAQAPIRQQRQDKIQGTYLADSTVSPTQSSVEWSSGRACYVCKRPYTEVHRFYDALCPQCGDANLAQRERAADLTGRAAIVTGGRVKIGFQVALKLLRAGATVSVTTRFPYDALERYRRERDHVDWLDRLRVFATDLRYLPGVELLGERLAAVHPELDILINNAAQTIRRPAAFYRQLIDRERQLRAELPRRLLAHLECSPAPPAATSFLPPTMPPAPTGLPAPADSPLDAVGHHTERGPVDAHWASLLSQLRLLPEDSRRDPREFPEEMFDRDGQPLDLRDANSWVQELTDVAAPELLEVHAVSSLAPFLLIQRLEPCLLRSPRTQRFIVNVAAMEGQLNARSKPSRHPHTNMAKAGLNMITRTCAESFAVRGVFMNSVDTGWITNEFPASRTEAMRDEGFEPPLDEIDGAARVCHPVFEGVESGQPLRGLFLKDYRPHPW